MANIVDSLKEYITPALISKASEAFGESNSGITKGIDSLIPSVLGGLIQKSNSPSDFGGIFDMIKGGAQKNPGILGNLGSLIGGNSPQKDLSGNLMSSLFGNKVGGILDLVSSVAGLKRSSSSGLMGLVGPLVMSYLGGVIKDKALDAIGLGKFLRNDANAVTRALPAGMGDLLGLGFAKNAGDAAKRVTSTTRDAVSSTKGALSSAGSKVTSGAKESLTTASRTVETTANKSGIGKWLIPLLLLLGIGGFFGMRSCGDVADATKGAVGSVADATKDVAGGVADVAGNAVDATKNAAGNVVDAAGDAAGAVKNAAGGALASLGEFMTKKLPCGIEMNIPGLGIENKVINFIQDDKAAISKTAWFNFDRLTFATGSANLDMAKSGEQIENIAQIMKCFPNVNVKLGGYTDNTGSAEGNMKLSAARANAVKAAIVAKVIDASRISTEGYGSAHPVASNDTAEGRAQNRRIALRVDAK